MLQQLPTCLVVSISWQRGQEWNIRLSQELCRIHLAHILSIIGINIRRRCWAKQRHLHILWKWADISFLFHNVSCCYCTPKIFFSCIFFIIRLHHSSPISFDSFFFFISHFTVRIPLNNVTYITGYVLCRRIDPYTIRCLIYELWVAAPRPASSL